MHKVLGKVTVGPLASDHLNNHCALCLPGRGLVDSVQPAAATDPGARHQQGTDTRYIDIHEGDELDQAQMAIWVKPQRWLAGFPRLVKLGTELGTNWEQNTPEHHGKP